MEHFNWWNKGVGAREGIRVMGVKSKAICCGDTMERPLYHEVRSWRPTLVFINAPYFGAPVYLTNAQY